jgi:hypothetical protein
MRDYFADFAGRQFAQRGRIVPEREPDPASDAH